ncbi:MAG: YceI family protein [Candidatus Hydrogenedentes bacterium]|nr:YceI family protein [Candidatus Hydrogenedentota bacterium]
MRLSWVIAGWCVVACATGAREYTVDHDKSVFAVVTHKEGVASKLAHDHLVYPSSLKTTLEIPEDGFEKAAFSLSFNVTDLVADEPEAQRKWFPLIAEAKVLSEPFKAVGAKDRETVREHMLARNQLDAAAHPKISAKLLSVRKAEPDEKVYKFVARVALTVKGKTVERDCRASYAIEAAQTVIEVHGKFKFTEFGIKPYSAFLGAVKNTDEFDVVAHIAAN